MIIYASVGSFFTTPSSCCYYSPVDALSFSGAGCDFEIQYFQPARARGSETNGGGGSAIESNYSGFINSRCSGELLFIIIVLIELPRAVFC